MIFRYLTSLAFSIFLSATVLAQDCVELAPVDGTPNDGVCPAGWTVWQSSPDIVAGNGPWPGGFGGYVVEDIDGVSTSGGQYGLFLANNGQGITGEGWQTTITGLTPGNTYTVSIEWQQCTLTNFGSVTYAGGELLIVVDGNPTYFTSSGGINDGWQTATVTFTATGPTATFQACVAEPAGGGIPGNYGMAIAIDDLTCSVVNVEAGPDQEVCEGSAVTVNGSGAASYTWDNGVTDGVAFNPPVGTTTYTVTGYDGGGAVVGTDQLEITVNALPSVGAGVDQTLCNDGTQITLNGSGATSYVWDNGITNGSAFTPALGTTTYTVTGTDANGCVNTDQVDVIVNPLPTIGAGTDLSVCDGEQVTLSGTGGISYVWDNGVVDNTAFLPPTSTTTTYTVTGTDANGCENTDQVDVTSLQGPWVDAGNTQTVCDGNQVTLAATGAVSYVWDNGVTDNVAFIPPSGATTTYTVTGTDANGCETSDQVNVVSVAPPAVDAGADQTICDGDLVTLSGAGAVNYVWDNGVTNGVAFNPPGGTTTTYSVTGTDANGCVNTDQVTITSVAAPTVDAGSDLEVCEGTSVTLTATGSGTITWDNGVTDGLAFTPTVGTTTYTVTAAFGGGCSAQDDVNVTVNANPTVNAGLDQNLCEGTQTNLTATGATSYVWDNGVVNGQTFTPSIGSTTYNVVGTDANGCIGTDAVVINVSSIPTVQFQADTLIGCDQLLVNFTNMSASGDQCTWDFGDGTIVQGCGDQQHNYTTDGLFTVSLTVSTAQGCTNQFIVSDYIQIYPAPNASFGLSQSMEGQDGYVYLNNNSNNAISYSWDFGDGLGQSSDEDPNYVYYNTSASNYTIQLTAIGEGGCVDSSQANVIFNEELVYFVPNAFTPNGDAFNNTFKPIFTSGFDYYDYHLTIFNRWGEIVFESYNSDYGWDGTYGDRGLVDDGVYIWQIDFSETGSDKRQLVNGHVTVLK